MKTIIRIERPDGIGMFMNDLSVYHIIELKSIANRHDGGKFPRPFNDRNVQNRSVHLDVFKNEKKWFCAYKSIEQL